MRIFEIKHKSKEWEPIFSFDVYENKLVSSTIDGEIHFYEDDSQSFRKIKKHDGAVLCVRFNPEGSLVASCCDNGYVMVYDHQWEVLFMHKSHENDVSGLMWTSKNLISVGHDGFVVFYSKDGSVVEKKFKGHQGRIIGVACSSDGKYLTTQGDDGIVLYRDDEVYKKIGSSEGVILEYFFSRMSWAPDNSLVACGLSFNNKSNSVELYDTELESKFSLIGHVAPSEVSAFNPNMFIDTKVYMVIAVASQDLSISLWNTFSPFPFLLLKNVTESPILDMKWNNSGDVLFYSSYDGVINKMCFEENELGKVFKDKIKVENPNLFFSMENIIMRKKYDEKIEMLKTRNEKRKLKEKDKIKKVSQHKEETITQNIKPLEMPIKEQINKVEVIIEKFNDANETESKPASKVIKRRRIKPILIEEADVLKKEGKDRNIYIFNYQNNLKIEDRKSDPFVKKLRDHVIELNKDRDVLTVKREEKDFFKIRGNINLVACSKNILCVYTDTLGIYDVNTSNLLLPLIGSIGISYIDIYKDEICYLEIDGHITILDVKKSKCTKVRVPKIESLMEVYFDKKFYLLLKYKDSKYFLDKKRKLWYLKEKQWNDMSTEDVDYNNVVDDTLLKLENKFHIYKSIKECSKLKSVVKSIVRKVRDKKVLGDEIENKLKMMFFTLIDLGQKNFVVKVLERMNNNFNLQYFIIEIFKYVKNK